MKKIYTFLIPLAAVAFVVLMAGFGGGDEIKMSSGAPPGYTNSPGDGVNCTHCMGGTAEAVTGWITSDIPPEGYVAAMTYNITVTASGMGNKGFECSPQKPDGSLVGTLAAGTGSQLVGGDKYVTHSAASSDDPKSWTFQWTAPNPGQGEVTFYACAAVGKLNTKTTMLTIQQSTLGIADQEALSARIYPNPVQDMVQVSFRTTASSPVVIDLVSLTGSLISSLYDGTSKAGDNTMAFPIDLRSGIYLLRIQAEGKSQVQKIIVQ
jgi:hypothetical protein